LARVLDDLAGAATGRTGLLHGEEALLHPYLAHALTGATGFRARAFFSATAVTGFTFFMARDVDLDGFAFNSLFQIQLQGVAKICTAGGSATTTTTEDVTEHITKDVGEAGATATKAAASLTVYAGMAELVVGGALTGVRQDFVGFAGLFEFVLGILVIRVTVRVVLHGELSVRPLNYLFVRIPGDPEYFVIIALGHASKPCFYNEENASPARVFPTT